MRLNIQLFGGRGASSSGRSVSSGGYTSFESLTSKRENMKYNLTFGTGVDMAEKVGSGMSSITSHKLKDLGKITKNINETVIQSQQGSFDKRISQMKNLGFKVISQTKPSENKTDIRLAYLRRG